MAISRKPAWLMDEYASMRLTFVWTTPTTAPNTSDSTASAYTIGCQSVAYWLKATMKTRARPQKAATLTADDMNTTAGVGEPSYTSGLQEWNGTAATLNPSPTRS